MVQKSGYFSRAAASNKDDVKLIKACAKVAVKVALDPTAKGGVVGQDENGDELTLTEGELHIMRVIVPPGRHSVNIQYDGQTSWKIAEMISLAAWLIFFWQVYRERKRARFEWPMFS